jgi:outer membrane protein assembly factor BamB
MLTRRAPTARSTGSGVCPACGASWPGPTARWCGACGAELLPTAVAGRPRRRDHLVLVVTIGVLALAAVVALVTVVLTGRPPTADRDALAVDLPDETPRSDLAVDVPTGPTCLAVADCVVWRHALPADDRTTSAAVVAGDLVVALGGDGVHAVDRDDGATRWVADLRGAPPRVGYPATFTVVDDLVLVQRHRRLTAHDLHDGEVAWLNEHGVEGVLTGQGTVDDRLVVVIEGVDDRGRTSVVLGLDADTGELQWRRDATRAVVTPAGVLAADRSGFRAFDGDGTQRWEDPGPVPAEWSAAAVGDGTVLVTSASRTALRSMADGTVSQQLPGHLLAEDGTAAVLAPAPRSGAVDDRAITLVAEGGVRWQATEPEVSCCLSASLLEDRVLLLTVEGRIVTLDRDDGEVAARTSPLATPTSEAVHLDGEVLVRQDPETTTLHATTGTGLVTLPRDRFPLRIAEDTVVVRDADGLTLVRLAR